MVAWLLEEHILERPEAVAVLKEIIHDHIVMPHGIFLKQNRRGKFDLVLKGDCDTLALRQFAAERNLALIEDAGKGFCAISKP